MAKYGAGWHMLASWNTAPGGEPHFLTGANDNKKSALGWVHNKHEGGTSLWLLPITKPGGPFFSGFSGQVFATEVPGVLMWETSASGPPM